MRDLTNKAAFVTGAASGIGLAMARAFLGVGMKVALIDVEKAVLQSATSSLSNYGDQLLSLQCDVSESFELERAFNAAVESFGKVHVICNNAGVSRAGSVERIQPSDWDWVISVNLMATINGVRLALSHMKAHGEGGHIVNTASIAGISPGALSGPYAVSKFGVIGLSEVLAQELAGSDIGVSVLCPSMIRTQMVDNGRNRPDRFGGSFDLASDTENAVRNARYLAMNHAGLDPDVVSPLVLDAIRKNRLYIFTHPESKAHVEARYLTVLAGFTNGAQ